MGAWAKDKGVGDKVVMLADGNGDFTRAVGLELDGTRFGMGQRSQRYALVAEDGVVKHLAVEEPSKFEVSKAETILGKL
jgi:peroxiredoxin